MYVVRLRDFLNKSLRLLRARCTELFNVCFDFRNFFFKDVYVDIHILNALNAMESNEEESLGERQENEVEVLKAIYDYDFEDLREKDVWKVHRPPELTLKIRPDHDSRGGHQEICTIDIHIKCSDRYPLIIPDLKLLNPKGLSDDLVNVLNDEIIDMSKKMIGEVMIMQIAQHVSSWLQVLNSILFLWGDVF